MAGPTIRRRRLGTDLRRLREARSLKLDEVAEHLGVAPSTLSRIETGKAPTRTSYLSVMLDLYGIQDADQRRTLLDLAREGQRKGWWSSADDLLPAGAGTYLGLEAEAGEVLAFGAQVLHGLVQTPGYARTVIAAARPELAADDAGRLADVQLRRQQVREAAGLRLHLVLDESVLHRALGSRAVLAGQLASLAAAAGDGWLRVQVLPLAAVRTVLTPSFGILRFAEAADPDVACAPGLPGQVLLEYRAHQVRGLTERFGALASTAIGPAESLAIIRDLAAQYR
ncbi:MAG: helix-turn-helix domain-containing protein [Streptosporangiaceae bacterium]